MLSTTIISPKVAFLIGKTEGLSSDNYFDMPAGKSCRINFASTAFDVEKELEVMCLNESCD